MSAIAIVGMACVFPDARSPRELWENVLARRRAFRRVPAERLRLEDYGPAAGDDGIYCGQAAVIEGYEFDRERYKVAGDTWRAVDPVHWLALDVAGRALADAGFAAGLGLPREACGVLVGNSLTGDASRAASMRLRWPYVERVAAAVLARQNLSPQAQAALLAEMGTLYKQPFPPVGEESLAGGLSNTIAGRICNHFDFHGGGFAVDGACSSSLLAVSQACAALGAGDLDFALAGGVDLSLDPFELVGFSRLGALARGDMRVYDQSPTGFLPGEGCGFVALMRADDALACGARAYALIRGWGMASDGGGGITRPEQAGQHLAITRAYRRAGFSAASVGYFEGHGTGTPVGDEIELAALAQVRREAGAARRAVVGSIKANIGHAKAAAGVAGLIKASLALHHQVLPPNSGLEHPRPELAGADAPFRALDHPEAWPADSALRAGVSSFGFGGINVHIALESEAPRRGALTTREAQLAAGWQDCELFLFAAPDAAALGATIARVAARAPLLSQAELTDLAVACARAPGAGDWRAALLAARPAELAQRAGEMLSWLEAGDAGRSRHADYMWLARRDTRPRIGLLFPGQAAPVRTGGGLMARRFDGVRALYAAHPLALPASGPIATDLAQPAIVQAELAALAVLQSFGIEAQFALGHSLGELAALSWAGALPAEHLLRLVEARGRAMASVPGPTGGMASLHAGELEALRWIEALGGGAVVAAYNAPSRSVISGALDVVRGVVALATSRGVEATLLPVSHAFHSPLMAPARPAFEAALAATPLAPLARRVLSSVSGAELDAQTDLPTLLSRQLTDPVRFTQALEHAAAAADLLIEAGPGWILRGLARAQTGCVVESLDAGGESLAGLLAAVGAAWSLGAALDLRPLWEQRFCRPYDMARPPRFFENPCEKAPPAGSPLHTAEAVPQTAPAAEVAQSEPAPAPLAAEGSAAPADALELVRALVAAKAELPLAAIAPAARLLKDLHLNSIAVGQLAAQAARQMGLAAPLSSTQFADASVGELAAALADLAATGATAPAAELHLAGVDAWVRAFVPEWVEAPLGAAPARRQSAPAHWQVFGVEGAAAAQLAAELAGSGSGGVLLCLPAAAEHTPPATLYAAAHAALAEGSASTFVLAQQQGGASSIARSVHLETGMPCCAVELPFDADLAPRLAQEVAQLHGYVEARHDAQGRRWVARLLPLAPAAGRAAPIAAGEVVIVSGGGKGIAVECAAALARAHGCKLALIGRSDPARDEELAANLRRFERQGASAHYFQADVADRAACAAAVARIRAELGPVAGLLHAAGTNRPALLADSSPASLAAARAGKLDGLQHLLDALTPCELRLLVAFSSIIGRAGLRGQCDYALVNEWLTRATERYQAAHPECVCLALEWSVWAGTGMGERLGRVEALLREGVTPIPIDAGVAHFMALVQAPPAAVAVVVAGRWGDAPTLRLPERELPFLRFLERIRVYYPGVELVAEAELAPDPDPWLQDHQLDGDCVLPAVLGMEAAAQAACAVLGREDLCGFDAVHFERPIVVAPGRPEVLRIAALARSADTVDVVLRAAGSAFQVTHFRLTCRFGPRREERRRPSAARPLQDGVDALYGGLLFQSGRFRRLQGYLELAATRCTACLAAPDDSPWFARYLPQRLLLGDAGSRDAALHAIQACVPNLRLLPQSLESWQAGALEAPGPWTSRARETWADGLSFVYDVDIIAADGRLRERWRGLKLRALAPYPVHKLPAPWLGTLIERRLARLTRLPRGASIPAALVAAEREAGRAQAYALVCGPGSGPLRRSDGKPEPAGGAPFSCAYAGQLTFATGGTACDIETICARSPDTWRDLLGARGWPLAQSLAGAAALAPDVAATFAWCALECLHKAGAPVTTPLQIGVCDLDANDGAWVELEAGEARIACGVLAPAAAAPFVVAVQMQAGAPEARRRGTRAGRH
ncbi:MAG: SDR family NAD(P)-dependent oxidoreductase [Rhodocyclaceae bacterium]|nr:SDR family NAD(P)-dependent oxidoreductase [Rhodocyclaceae bacterium]